MNVVSSPQLGLPWPPGSETAKPSVLSSEPNDLFHCLFWPPSWSTGKRAGEAGFWSARTGWVGRAESRALSPLRSRGQPNSPGSGQPDALGPPVEVAWDCGQGKETPARGSRPWPMRSSRGRSASGLSQ